jgi:hypothetical protein
MHSAALSILADVSDAVYDKSLISTGKYNIWNKTMTYHHNFKTSTRSDLSSNGKTIVFGVDAIPLLLGDGINLVPTVFLGSSRENLSYDSSNSIGSGFIGGLKLCWNIEDYGNLIFLCSYGNIGNGSRDYYARTHLFSTGICCNGALLLEENVALMPQIQLDYMSIIPENIQIKYASVNHKNFHNLKTAAGVSLRFTNDNLAASVGAKFVKRFGGNLSGTCCGKEIPSFEKNSSSHLELNAKISGEINDAMHIDLTVGKTCDGRKGCSAGLTLSVAL